MDELKKCSKCKTISLKSKFNKDKTKNDGLNPICKVCRIGYYNEKREQRREYGKFYARQNRARINTYERFKRKNDPNFNLFCNIRQRTKYAFKSQTIGKINDLIGCSNYFFRRWIIHQLYGDMTIENYGKIWCLDHSYPLSKISLSNENELLKYTNWLNIRPMYIRDNIIKSDKIDYHLYLLQEVKAKYFLKLNNDQERLD